MTAPENAAPKRQETGPHGPHRGSTSGSGGDKWGSGVESRLARLEATTESILERLKDFRSDVDRRFDEIRADSRELRGDIDRRFDAAERRSDKTDADLRVLLAFVVAGFLGLAGLMAHGFKWF